MKRLLLLTIAVLTGPAMNSAVAASPPATAYEGIIDLVDARYDVVIINDTQFSIGPAVPVHESGGTSSRGSLSKGMRVRYTAILGDKRQIIEMWIVP